MIHLRRKYREASSLDAAAVTDLAQQFHSQSYQRVIDFNWDKMCDWVDDRICSDDSLVLGCWSGKDLAGCIIGMTFQHPYSDTLVAGDYIWYVKPEYRGGMIGVRLMRIFEDWARDAGASQILTGATSGVNTERGAALLARLGYVSAGTLTYKDV